MKFDLIDEIPFPRDVVFATQRDKLPELVPYMPNVESIVVEKREVDGPQVKLLNLWKGNADDIPKVIAPLIKSDMMQWYDKATWDEATHICHWEIEINVMPGAISAKGTTEFDEEGDETVVRIAGEFIVHPDKIPLPGFVARRAAPTIEKFVVNLIKPNLKETNKVVARYIADHQD